MARLADLVGLVGLLPVQRSAVLIREHGDSARSQFVRGAERPDGDLTAIGDQYLPEHAHLAGPASRWGLSVLLSLGDGNVDPCARTLRQLPQGRGRQDDCDAGTRFRRIRAGVRTLVVDLDPQSDVSTGMDIQVAGRLNVADVLANPKEKVVRQAITSSGWAKVHPGTIDVMIGSPSAINFDGPHPSVRDVWKLEEALATIEADYDLVLIDCAPSLNALTRTAWAAATA